MGFTMVGLVMLSQAGSFPMLLVAAAMIGIGSSIFHPESSRVARLSSGGPAWAGAVGFSGRRKFRHGASARSSRPSSSSPDGQGSIVWFSAIAMLGMVVLSVVGRWYQQRMAMQLRAARAPSCIRMRPCRVAKVIITMTILVALVFSKFFYLASISSYYTFYLIHRSISRCRRAAAAVRVFGGGGPRHRARRPDRGSDRPQTCDLGLDPRASCPSPWRCPMSALAGPSSCPSSSALSCPPPCRR